MKRLRIAVIGCGTAGPALARFLANAHHRVEIFERAHELLPVGTGFILQPTGLWVLESLGLREEVEQFGAPLVGLRAFTVAGRRLLDLEYRRIGEHLYGLGMHRASLLDVLVDGLPDLGVALHLGADVRSIERRGSECWLRVGDDERGPFDFIVVAGGAHSPLRGAIAPVRRARRYPWGALWSIRPDPARIFSERLHQIVDGTHTMLGLLPTGTRRHDPEATPLVSVFWSTRVEHSSVDDQGGADALERRICALEPRAAELEWSGAEWSFAEYMDVVMSRLHGPLGVVLGDAAHAMSPQLGQGVNLALWDARELAHALSDAPDLGTALARFDRSRRRHLAFYQRATRWLTPFFQSRIPGAGLARDVFMPIFSRSRFLDRQALLSMSGLKTGWLGALPVKDD
jgi:2-polyprenyl-6-methoxyphenol hydroxylase-like FAD-dependent oxidoreductase